ncbi:MAG TPA: TonB-dependent receptor [Rhizomicrobium sp.]|nr:TonB-dependent receptor [Rhizomicrobium sp.]
MTIFRLLLAGTCLALAAAPAFADRAIETVVVKAAPPDPVGNDVFSVVRVTPEQIRTEHQLDQALKEVPGLSLFRRDGSLSANPTTQGVTLRSLAPSGAGRALVTLDGVPQNDPFGNWVIWSALPGEDVDAAEIVRGAGAGPYGAGALTGVIALEEASGTGLVAADLSSGTRWQRRAAAAGGAEIDRFEIFASASAEASNGWKPVLSPQRGPADDALTLDARNVSLRVQTTVDSDTLISARFGAYQEFRNSGLVGAESSADGLTASLTIAHPESADALGWRAQVWLRDVGLTNTSVSIGPFRQSTTVTNNQYAVPATGWGGNAALRGQWDWLNWELGGDARFSEGESRELFSSGLSMRRISGGRASVAGVYAEGAARFDGLLVTVGLRADEWETANGHLVESDAATGAISKSLSYPSRSGTLPTARAGLRYDLGGGLYLRGAAYEGFRAPSLNELYRPFRVGLISTLANPALTPENLYGIEGGIGGDEGPFSWQATFFWNQLHNAIANVTVGTNLQMRENAGNIDAPGIEADATWRLDDWLNLRGAFDYVAARTRGGLHPAQAPRWTATAGFEATPFRPVPLTLSADLRYESGRFADDLNTIPLSAATTIDARASWALTKELAVYIYADNLFNAHVASTAAQQPVPYSSSNDLVTTYSAPRIVGAGVSFAQ